MRGTFRFPAQFPIEPANPAGQNPNDNPFRLQLGEPLSDTERRLFHYAYQELNNTPIDHRMLLS